MDYWKAHWTTESFLLVAMEFRLASFVCRTRFYHRQISRRNPLDTFTAEIRYVYFSSGKKNQHTNQTNRNIRFMNLASVDLATKFRCRSQAFYGAPFFFIVDSKTVHHCGVKSACANVSQQIRAKSISKLRTTSDNENIAAQTKGQQQNHWTLFSWKFNWFDGSLDIDCKSPTVSFV